MKVDMASFGKKEDMASFGKKEFFVVFFRWREQFVSVSSIGK